MGIKCKGLGQSLVHGECSKVSAIIFIVVGSLSGCRAHLH